MAKDHGRLQVANNDVEFIIEVNVVVLLQVPWNPP